MIWIILLNLILHSPSVQAEKVESGGVSFKVVEIDLATTDLKLYWKKTEGQAFQNLTELRKALGSSFVFATNAGIYGKNGAPLGLHVERGVTLNRLNRSRASTGNFFMIPNGIFALTKNGPRLFETSEFAKLKPEVLEATQSGPLLVYRGKIHPKFRAGSVNRKFRSGVGIRSDGRVIFAISKELIGFYEFAQFFKEQLNCQDALYLDGTISTFLEGESDPGSQLAPYVGMLAATKKRE